MADKIKEDRRKDGDIDDEFSFDSFEDFDLDNPMGDGTEGGGGRKPTSAAKRNVIAGLNGVGKGVGLGIVDEITKATPNVKVLTDEISDTFEEIKMLKEELGKQAGPLVASVESMSRKLLPKAEKFIPKKFYDKIKNTLDEREEERKSARAGQMSKEEMQNAQITEELNQIFNAQADLARMDRVAATEQHMEAEATAGARHKQTSIQLSHVYESLRSTELFHKTLHSAYLKKSLELKYKHIFIARDTFNLLSTSMATFESYFKGIVKNTSLPDMMKTNIGDYHKARRKQHYGDLYANFLSTARKKIFDAVKKKASDALGQLNSMAGMATMMDGMDGMGMDTGAMIQEQGAALGGEFVGRGIGGAIGKKLLKKIAPFARGVDMSAAGLKARAYMGLSKAKQKMENSDSRLLRFLSDFMPSMSAGTTGTNDLIDKADEAETFDKITKQSIVEIIPGYLGKIWHSIEMMRLGTENVEEKTFNVYTRKFTTVSQMKTDLEEKLYGSEDDRKKYFINAVGAMSAGMKRNNQVTDPSKQMKGFEKDINRILQNHATRNLPIDPVSIRNFVMDPTQGANSYIQNISKGIENDPLEVLKMFHASMFDEHGMLDKRVMSDISNAIMGMMTIESHKSELPKLAELYGYRHLFSDKFDAKTKDALKTAAEKGDKEAAKKLKEGSGLFGDRNEIGLDQITESKTNLDYGGMGEDITREFGSKLDAYKQNDIDRYDAAQAAQMLGLNKLAAVMLRMNATLGTPIRWMAERMGITEVGSAMEKKLELRDRADAYDIDFQSGMRAGGNNVIDMSKEMTGPGELTQIASKLKFAADNPMATFKAVTHMSKEASETVDAYMELLSKAKSNEERLEIMKMMGSDAMAAGKNAMSKAVETGKQKAQEAYEKGKEYVEKGKEYVRDAYETASNTKIGKAVKSAAGVAGEFAKEKLDEAARKIDEFRPGTMKEIKDQLEVVQKTIDSIKASGVKGAKDLYASAKETISDGKDYAATIVALFKEADKDERIELLKMIGEDLKNNVSHAASDFTGAMANTLDKISPGASATLHSILDAAKEQAGKLAGKETDKDRTMGIGGWLGGFIGKPTVVKGDDGKLTKAGEAGIEGIFPAIAKDGNLTEKLAGKIKAILGGKKFKGKVSIGGESAVRADDEKAEDPLNAMAMSMGKIISDGESGNDDFGDEEAAFSEDKPTASAKKPKSWIEHLTDIFKDIRVTVKDEKSEKTEKPESPKSTAETIRENTTSGTTAAPPGEEDNRSTLEKFFDTYKETEEHKAEQLDAILDAALHARGSGMTGGIGRAVRGLGKAAGKTLSKAADVYKTVYSGALKGLGTAAKGAFDFASKGLGMLGKAAKWAVTAPPYVDIYLKGHEGEQPIVSVRQQKMDPGIIFKKSGARVERSADINEPCVDPRTGELCITEEDLNTGLVMANGSPLGKAAKMMGAGLKNIGKGYTAIYSAAIKAAVSVANTVAKGIFGGGGKEAEKFIDIYRKDEVGDPYKPILTRLKQERDPGVQFADGSRVERSSDIHEPVIDPATGKEVISKDDIEHGLVDANNTPLSKATAGGGGGGGGLIGKVLKMLPGAAKGLGKVGGKLLDFYGDFYKKILGMGWEGIKGVGKFAGDFINNKWGGGKTSKEMLDVTKGIAQSLVDIKTTIRDWYEGKKPGAKAGDKDGDGDIDGSYEDQQQKKKEEEARNGGKKGPTFAAHKDVDYRKDAAVAATEGEEGGESILDKLGGLIPTNLRDKLGKIKGVKTLGKLNKIRGVLKKPGSLIGMAGSLTGLLGGKKAADAAVAVGGDEEFGGLLEDMDEDDIMSYIGKGKGSPAISAKKLEAIKKSNLFGRLFKSKWMTGLAGNRLVGAAKTAGTKVIDAEKFVLNNELKGAKFLGNKGLQASKFLGGKAATVGKFLGGKAATVGKFLGGKAATVGKFAGGKTLGLLGKAGGLVGKLPGVAGLTAKAAPALMNAGGLLGAAGPALAAAAPYLAGAAAIAGAGYLGYKALGIGGLIKGIKGNDNPLTEKEIEQGRAKLQHKIDKGLPGYDRILQEFEKAVSAQNWRRARELSGQEADGIIKSMWKESWIGKGARFLFGSKDKEMSDAEQQKVRDKFNSIISKGGPAAKHAEKLLAKFDSYVEEGDWANARKLADMEDRGVFGKMFQDSKGNVKWGKLAATGLGFLAGGPIGALLGYGISAALSPDDPNAPMSESEVKKHRERLQKLATGGNKAAEKLLEKFDEAVTEMNWKKARQIVGEKSLGTIAKLGKGLKSTAKWFARVHTLGLSMLFETSDDEPMKDEEIKKFTDKMNYLISKGDKMAEKKLDKFQEAIAQQNWRKARSIAKMPHKAAILRAVKAVNSFFWGDDDKEMTEQEMQKFRDSMNRKIQLGNKSAQRKLDAFEDAVGRQNWRKARILANNPNDGLVQSTAKAVGKGLAAVGRFFFGGDGKPMDDAELEKARKRFQGDIADGKKGAQKRSDLFEDYVADEKWEKARKLAKMPYENVVKRVGKAIGSWLFGSKDKPMDPAEIDKFREECEQRISDGNPKAEKILEKFNDYVEAERWDKARELSGIKDEGVVGDVKKGAKKVWNWLTGNSDRDDCMKKRDELEEKAMDDSTGILNEGLTMFDTLVRRQQYNDAMQLAEDMLKYKPHELQGKYKLKSEEFERFQKESEELFKKIDAAQEENNGWTHPIKEMQLGMLKSNVKNNSAEWSDDFFADAKDRLAQITGKEEYASDYEPPDESVIKRGEKLLKNIDQSSDNYSWLGSPIIKTKLASLKSEVKSETANWDDDTIDEWYDRLKEIDQDFKGEEKEKDESDTEGEDAEKERKKEEEENPNDPKKLKARYEKLSKDILKAMDRATSDKDFGKVGALTGLKHRIHDYIRRNDGIYFNSDIDSWYQELSDIDDSFGGEAAEGEDGDEKQAKFEKDKRKKEVDNLNRLAKRKGKLLTEIKKAVDRAGDNFPLIGRLEGLRRDVIEQVKENGLASMTDDDFNDYNDQLAEMDPNASTDNVETDESGMKKSEEADAADKAKENEAAAEDKKNRLLERAQKLSSTIAEFLNSDKGANLSMWASMRIRTAKRSLDGMIKDAPDELSDKKLNEFAETFKKYAGDVQVETVELAEGAENAEDNEEIEAANQRKKRAAKLSGDIQKCIDAHKPDHWWQIDPPIVDKLEEFKQKFDGTGGWFGRTTPVWSENPPSDEELDKGFDQLKDLDRDYEGETPEEKEYEETVGTEQERIDQEAQEGADEEVDDGIDRDDPFGEKAEAAKGEKFEWQKERDAAESGTTDTNKPKTLDDLMSRDYQDEKTDEFGVKQTRSRDAESGIRSNNVDYTGMIEKYPDLKKRVMMISAADRLSDEKKADFIMEACQDYHEKLKLTLDKKAADKLAFDDDSEEERAKTLAFVTKTRKEHEKALANLEDVFPTNGDAATGGETAPAQGEGSEQKKEEPGFFGKMWNKAKSVGSSVASSVKSAGKAVLGAVGKAFTGGSMASTYGAVPPVNTGANKVMGQPNAAPAPGAPAGEGIIGKDKTDFGKEDEPYLLELMQFARARGFGATTQFMPLDIHSWNELIFKLDSIKGPDSVTGDLCTNQGRISEDTLKWYASLPLKLRAKIPPLLVKAFDAGKKTRVGGYGLYEYLGRPPTWKDCMDDTITKDSKPAETESVSETKSKTGVRIAGEEVVDGQPTEKQKAADTISQAMGNKSAFEQKFASGGFTSGLTSLIKKASDFKSNAIAAVKNKVASVKDSISQFFKPKPKDNIGTNGIGLWGKIKSLASKGWSKAKDMFGFGGGDKNEQFVTQPTAGTTEGGENVLTGEAGTEAIIPVNNRPGNLLHVLGEKAAAILKGGKLGKMANTIAGDSSSVHTADPKSEPLTNYMANQLSSSIKSAGGASMDFVKNTTSSLFAKDTPDAYVPKPNWNSPAAQQQGQAITTSVGQSSAPCSEELLKQMMEQNKILTQLLAAITGGIKVQGIEELTGVCSNIQGGTVNNTTNNIAPAIPFGKETNSLDLEKHEYEFRKQQA